MPNALISSPLFAGLRPAEVEDLLRSGRRERLPDRGVLFKEGDSGDDFAVVEAGQAIIEKVAADGRVRDIATVGPGAVLGEVAGALRAAAIGHVRADAGNSPL